MSTRLIEITFGRPESTSGTVRMRKPSSWLKGTRVSCLGGPPPTGKLITASYWLRV